MYASYFYNAGSTAADILADVVAMLTGETTVNDLSTSCDKTKTQILTTYCPAGWTVHDASAGTNQQVLKAAVADNENQFKYLFLSTATVNYLITGLYENWNAATHTGTNQAYQSDTFYFAQMVDVTLGGRLEISASARHLSVYGKTFSGAWGVSYNGTGYPTSIFERTRLAEWDTPTCGYLPAVWLYSTTGGGYSCRQPDIQGEDDVSTQANIEWFCPFTAVTSSLPTVGLFRNGTSVMYPLIPFGYSRLSKLLEGGFISSLSYIFLTLPNIFGFGDTLLYNNQEYTVWPCSNGATCLVVRKG